VPFEIGYELSRNSDDAALTTRDAAKIREDIEQERV
jgi:hypothetical protein